MKRVFIDANIVIDALMERQEWMNEAYYILSVADKGNIEVFCSPLSLATASYLMERAKMPHDIFRRKLDVFTQICTPTSIDADIVQQAIHSSFQDFEDALQYYSALRIKADVIITRNGKDFTESTIPVMTAAEYIATI